MKRLFRIVTLLVCALTLSMNPGSLQAQVLYGSIVGVVQDATGSVIPGATVLAVNPETRQERTVATDGSGRYSLPNLAAGNYEITVTASGFRTLTRRSVSVSINTIAREDFRLEIGALTEQVTVTASAARLQTETGAVQSDLMAREVTDLPLAKYRNYQTLINLIPGATPGRFQNVNNPMKALTTNVNGVNRNNNATKLDGSPNRFTWLPHHTLYVPPAETIEAVSISTNSFDAEQGMAGGAAITIATKSGTNDFHGSAFSLHENSKWGAKNFFFRGGPKTPKSLINIFGGTLGGPIKRDKLFFFGGWERVRERVNYGGLFTVPTLDQRNGDFSAYPATIYDPGTGNADGSGRTPFPNRIIPSNRLSPVATRFQEWIPLPNLSGVNANYFNSATQVLDRDNFDGKVNWNRTSSHAVFAKYSAMRALHVGEFALGQAGGDCLCAGGVGRGRTRVQLASVGHTLTFSPTLLWDGTLSWNRIGSTHESQDFGTNFGSEVLEIPGTNGPDRRQSGLPDFLVSGYSTLGNRNPWWPYFWNDMTYSTTHNFSWKKGAHEIRWGYEGLRLNLNHWQPELGGGPRGSFDFNQEATGLRGSPTTQFNGWASFLLGLPQQARKSVQWIKMTGYEWQHGLYVRDRWEVTRHLTLSLGVRYELYPLMTRANYGGIEQWDETTNVVRIGGLGGNPKDLGISTSKKLFAPRIGLAYRAADNLVIRTGYGITYNPMPLARPLRSVYPLTIAQDFTGINAYQPFRSIEEGIPDFGGPELSSGSVPLPGTVAMITIAGDSINRGYVQSWNFFVEGKLPGDFVTSVGYVGTQTVNSFGQMEANVAAPGRGNLGRRFVPIYNRTAATSYWNGQFSANYHALQVAINRRAAAGLTLKAAYTYSKAINFTDDDGGVGVMFNWEPAFYRNRALAGYDIPHMLQLGYVYELPFGKGKNMANTGVASVLLGGWQANGIFSAVQGRPFTVAASAGSLDAPGNSQTADQVKPEVEKIGSLAQFYDRTSFAAPTGAARFGTTGRNLLRGPGIVNLDLSLFRNFNLTERYILQFRAEAANLSNTPHFGNPSNNVNSGNFMQITSAENDQRTIRFGLRLQF
ncbi:MAG TPA: TonB-dependent receptor [Bryobacteraceae bacterium]|nr:TonB-dependent receptor [Bryobacteraceae bacterium]